MLHEFDIIRKYFAIQSTSPLVKLGVGDDCALLHIPRDHLLATSVDTLVEGVHFFKKARASDLGHKSLAVSLSDLSAMGATPCAVLLALTLPNADNTWLSEFAQGFFDLAKAHQVTLMGGNITHGPLNISTTVYGMVPNTQAIKRNGAQVNDLIFVTGTLGDAALALQLLKENKPGTEPLLARYHRPTPQVTMGEALRNLATSAIDISDGLAQDLTQLLAASKIGATIIADDIPLSSYLSSLAKNQAMELALNGGEDYQLCFTVAPENKPALLAQADKLNIKVHCIGNITQDKQLTIVDKNNQPVKIKPKGWQHF